MDYRITVEQWSHPHAAKSKENSKFGMIKAPKPLNQLEMWANMPNVMAAMPNIGSALC